MTLVRKTRLATSTPSASNHEFRLIYFKVYRREVSGSTATDKTDHRPPDIIKT
ncbi:hypothetical protein MINT15_39710 [Saccharomonospora viridis]|uniref:Uncharacterized protein n=2 Tax=Saccharomonospora viridis TaxID=1852 RepID=C7N089_SACVD|nr:hypothetical protein Svir_26370 [Saccharomonospora viridis DSM 43017]KHF42165.1 hypothetical protein MINT15_39710 [Saccharomonospora viridis]